MLHLPREHAQQRNRPWPLACLLLAGLLFLPAHPSLAQTAEPENRVVAVRYWTLGDVTRVAIETSEQCTFTSDHLENPNRIFFDLLDTKPQMTRGIKTIAVGDRRLRQIRIAETQRGVTRIVLDLQGDQRFVTSQLDNPQRLIVELRAPDASESSALDRAAHAPLSFHAPASASLAGSTLPESLDSKPLIEPAQSDLRPARRADPLAAMPVPLPPPMAPPRRTPSLVAKVLANPAATAAAISAPAAPDKATLIRPPSRVPPSSSGVGLPARRKSTDSMTRVLGLKIHRIVLDAGHGGHDTGTIGPGGLAEKDVVLDVARRLGALIEDRMGSEVVYTRSDDTFIPLERRTAIANENKADLFLSIHANSSPVRTVAGVETYYLSFTTSQTALDVAARENASADGNVFELQDLLKKIALKDKVDESRDFAGHIQTSLFGFSAKTNSHARDRGVRKAPFVVLIGASMPSVLAEIGFISNTRDESEMRKPEYRERMAEALYKGLSAYAMTLSHYQVAKNGSGE